MKFFRKSKPDGTEPDGHTARPDAEPQQPARTPGAAGEEEARKWFSERFGTDMPDEVARMFRQIAAAPAKQAKAGGQVLDDNELRRIQDSMRLHKTKLANIRQTLDGLQAQKEWLHKFTELKATLEKQRQAFFESNKNYNARMKAIKELERFEAFEEVQGDYQHIKAKEAVLQLVRKESSPQALRLAEAQTQEKAEQKQAETDRKKYQEALQQLQQAQKALKEGYSLLTALQIHEDELEELQAYRDKVEKMLEAAQKQSTETDGELARNQAQAAQEQQTRQNLEAQQKMLEKGEVIQVRLSFLQSLGKRKEQLQNVLERMQKSQHEQDEKLNKLFLSSQETDAQIKTLQSELQVHRKSVVGMNSYNLQQRAMDLKSRKERLTNATELWKQIAEGYIRIDEKSQEIMRMRLHNETLKAQIAQLEPETAGLQRQCEELKYAYTLSKSQDVMQLREDLQEGVSCSVCGATHHPYHSDTLLEQSKLIGEIKRNFEQTAAELKNKQSLLEDLKRQQALEEGHLELGHKALETYKKILQDQVNHWNAFTDLDRTFKDCSASTNFDARRIMLQQLVEKTGLDAEEAQKELDTFNYHQSCINALNEKIAQKELEKSETAVRVNEVNTGCQVIAYRVEQLQQSLSRANSQYSELFEEIDRMMALSNWYKVWKENPENLRIYIQQQMERWFGLKEDMARTRNETIRLKTMQEMLREGILTLRKQRDFVYGKIEQITERRDQMREQLHKIFPDGDVATYHQSVLEALGQAEEQKEESARKAVEARAEAERQKGYNQRMADTAQELEAQIARERSALDVWIRKYNATHSPVQFSELEQTFNSPTDWNAIREEIRQLTLRNMLAEARADEARLALAAHQVNALSQGQDTEDRTAALNTEIARLESEQEHLLVQLAGCQARLDAHELGLQKQAAEEARLSAS